MVSRGGGSVSREPAAEVSSAGLVSRFWCGQASLCDLEQAAEEDFFLELAGFPEDPGSGTNARLPRHGPDETVPEKPEEEGAERLKWSQEAEPEAKPANPAPEFVFFVGLRGIWR